MSCTPLKHWALYSAPLLIILAVIWAGFANESDVALFFKDHRAAHAGLAAFMRLVTNWCNPVFYVFYAAMLFFAWRSGDREKLRFVLVLLVVQGLVAGLAVHFTKYVIGRPRPGEGHWYAPLSGRYAQVSLPSGHTTEITGWTLPLALRSSRTAVSVLLGLFVGLAGFSRIYLGWHHPTDVFFGWLLGSVGGFAAVIIAESSLFRRS
ncbi:phosphatase PAP2 family protein [Pseudodesulfovibrio thermohalotolerans]|uniref:phosphatase PAP2 family protein n=1 Tax=Pseudodesulfovibrio thermohalotolerans TaxID=2880651 RepID=UPI0022B9EC37|nr:phosphatase PAP2 family protein [Pseudodesulfovibrio thermohalotolerans]WFS63565.1 phosphatase PAP2 family protein [Pseudodesulfovibrio thermohalotolerans]